jgi:MOSC domain-containing protein YiiM
VIPDAVLESSQPQPGAQRATNWSGVVTHLHVTARAFLPMRPQESIELVAGRGIVGDRYMLGIEQGYYSEKPEEGRQVTLFESEVLEAISRDYKAELLPEEHRRNITTSGVPLNWLVGKRFHIGSCLVEATRLSVPCRHIEQILDKQVFDAMVHRSGLNCRILVGGAVRMGDEIRPD